MSIEKDAEKIIDEFSKTLDNIPDSEETWYITDNSNYNNGSSIGYMSGTDKSSNAKKLRDNSKKYLYH